MNNNSEMDKENTTVELNADEVRDFIEGNAFISDSTKEKILNNLNAKKDKENKDSENELTEKDLEILNIGPNKEKKEEKKDNEEDDQIRYKHAREFLNPDTGLNHNLIKDIKNVEITEKEKEDFLRAVDLDNEFTLKISLNKNSKFCAEFRVKTTNEVDFLERYIYETAVNEKLANIDSLRKLTLKASLVTQLTNFFYADEKATKEIKYSASYEEFKEILDSRLKEFNKLSSIKYLMYVNALRIFDEKFSKLSEMYLNEDF